MDWLSSWFATSEDEKRRTVEQLQWLSTYGPRLQRLQAQDALARIVGSTGFRGIPRGPRGIEGFYAATTELPSIDNQILFVYGMKTAFGIFIYLPGTIMNVWETNNYINSTTGAKGTRYSNLVLLANTLKNLTSFSYSANYTNDAIAASTFTINYTIKHGANATSTITGSISPTISQYIPGKVSYSCPSGYSKDGLTNCSRSYFSNIQNKWIYENIKATISYPGRVIPSGNIGSNNITFNNVPYIKEITFTQSPSSIITSSSIVIGGQTVSIASNTTYTNYSLDWFNNDINVVYVLSLINVYSYITSNFSILPNYEITVPATINITTDTTNATEISNIPALFNTYSNILTTQFDNLRNQVLKLMQNVRIFSQFITTYPSTSYPSPFPTTTNIETLMNTNITTITNASSSSIMDSYKPVMTIYNTVLFKYNQLVADGFKVLYETVRQYIEDADLATETIETRKAIYQNTSYTTEALSAAIRNIVSTLIIKYGTATNTTIPTADVITDSTPITTIKTLYTNYTTVGNTGKWDPYITTLKSSITSLISTYNSANIPSTNPFYILPATVSSDRSAVPPAKTVSANGDVLFGSFSTHINFYNSIATKYRDIIAGINTITDYKAMYGVARRYLSDTQLATNTNLRQAVFSNTTFTAADLLASYRSIIGKCISEYNTLTGSTADSTADISNMTIPQLKTLQAKYIGGVSGTPATAEIPLWAAYETALVANIGTTINNYLQIQNEIPQTSPNFITNSVSSADISNANSAKIVSNITTQGVVSFGVEQTPTQVFAGSTVDANYIANGSGTQTTSSYRYRDASANWVYIYGSTSSDTRTITPWSANANLINVMNPDKAGTANSKFEKGGRLIIQLTSALPIEYFSYEIDSSQASLQLTTKFYSGTSITALTEITTFTSIPSSNPKLRIFKLASTVSSSFYAITISGQTTDPFFLIGGIKFYNGQQYSRQVDNAIVYLNTILTKYKTVVDAIALQIRAPATTSIQSFRTMYNILTKCIPPGFATNPTYSPTVAADRDAETDLRAIGTTLNKTTLAEYTSKYTAAIITTYNTLRTDQLAFLQNYKAVYDAYFNMQGNFSTFVRLPTTEITSNAADIISSFPDATTTLPSQTLIDALAATCNTYNGPNGLFDKLLQHIKTNATATFVEFERLYNPMPQFIKDIVKYVSPLDASRNLSSVTVGTALSDLKTNYDLLTGVFMSSTYGAYMTYRHFLSAVDITQAMADYAAKCEAYQPQTTFTLLTGDTYAGLIGDGIAFIEAFSAAFVGRFQALYEMMTSETMTSRGLSVSDVVVPATVNADKTAKGRDAWAVIDKYGNLFTRLVGSLQTSVAAKIDEATSATEVKKAAAAVVEAVKTKGAGAVAVGGSGGPGGPEGSGGPSISVRGAAASATGRGAATIASTNTKVMSESKGFAAAPTGSGGPSTVRDMAEIAKTASKTIVSNTPPTSSRGSASAGQGSQGAAAGGQGSSSGGQGVAAGGQGASQGAVAGGQGASQGAATGGQGAATGGQGAATGGQGAATGGQGR
jgi:hypothetical protein